MAYLYRHIRLDKNEPFYIGIATHLKRAYDKSSRKNKIWQSIIAKTEYEVEILFDDLTKEEVYIKEIEFIKLYGKIYNNTGTLANLTDGGETISDYNKGRKASEETRAKLREAAKYKKPKSKESYQKTADALRGRPKSEEHKRKLSEHFKGISNGPWKEEQRKKNLDFWIKKYLPIAQYDLDGNLIKIWDNRIIASIELGLKKDHIRECLRGRRKHYAGYKWVSIV